MDYAASVSILPYKSGMSAYLLHNRIKSWNMTPVESYEEKQNTF